MSLDGRPLLSGDSPGSAETLVKGVCQQVSLRPRGKRFAGDKWARLIPKPDREMVPAGRGCARLSCW